MDLDQLIPKGSGSRKRTVDEILSSSAASPSSSSSSQKKVSIHSENRHPDTFDYNVSYHNSYLADDLTIKLEPLDEHAAKKLVLALEKSIKKNQNMRIKYASEPEKFMESEVELDEQIRNTMALAAFPDCYSILVEIDLVGSLLSLLSHENTDIVIGTLELLRELTDEQVSAEDSNAEESLALFARALVDGKIFELILQNLQRMDNKDHDGEDDTSKGVYSSLGIFENLTALDEEYAISLAETPGLLSWLFRGVNLNSSGSDFDGNMLYSAEILSIVLQSGNDRIKSIALKEQPFEILLSSISKYRKRDPIETDEDEYLENLFDCVCALLSGEQGKFDFLKAEGVELMILLLKERKYARMKALKTLSFAVSGVQSVASLHCCNRFVENLGLKQLIGCVMKTHSKKLKKDYPKVFVDAEEDEYSMVILVNLLKYLDDQAPDFLLSRLLLQFDGKEGVERIDRLCKMHHDYDSKLSKVVEARKQVDYFDLMDSGLYALQMIDCSLVLLCSQEAAPQIRDEIMQRLDERSIATISQVIKEYIFNLLDSSASSDDETTLSALRKEEILLLRALGKFNPDLYLE